MQRSFRLLEYNIYDDVGPTDETFNPYEDNKDFMIQMFGLNEKGETAAIYVEGFQPFFYLQVYDNWTDIHRLNFINHLKNKMGTYYENSIVISKLIKRKTLYKFDAGKEYNFILIKFKNTGAFNKAKKLWFIDTNIKGVFNRKLKTEGYEFEGEYIKIYESHIPPLLRFFHIKDISPSGWVALQTNKYLENKIKSTTCTYEFTINYKHIISLPNKETQVPYKICSYDIEASSSHGDFPIPIKNYKKLGTNIVDIWLKNRSQWLETNMTKNEYRREIKQMIISAFNYGKYKKIDIVYTKTKVTEEELDILFDVWIKIVPAAEKFSNYIENEEIEDNQAELIEYHDVEDEIPIEANGYEKVYYTKKEKIKVYNNKEGDIIDLLNDENCTRDTKILELTRTLDKIFPSIKGDTVTFIGSRFRKYGEKEEYLNHCIVLKGCSIPNNVKYVTIESYNTEQEVLLAWTKLIQKEDPDIVLCYNGNGFDYDFMDKRAQELDCRKKFLMLSRNIKEVCLNKDWKTKKEDIEKSKIIIASGEHNLRFIKMNGRLQIDLYNYFRREYQLSSYKLDYISGYFISDIVKSIKHIDNSTIITTKNLKGLDVGSYINFEERSYSIDYYKEGKKFEVKEINLLNNSIRIDGIENLNMNKDVKWCLAKDDVDHKQIFKLAKGSDDDRAIIAKYCINDCGNVLDIFLKNDILTSYIEMSKLCSIPINYLVMRGQGIKLTSYVSLKCRQKNTLIPVIEKVLEDDGFEGATVLEPKCDLYLDDPVACVDYSSLYPSSMISENLSQDSKVWTKEYDLSNNLIEEKGEQNEKGEYIYDNLKEYKYVDIEYDTYKWARKSPSAAATKIKIGYKICRFAQFPNEEKGILPSILEELLAARKATKKLAAQAITDNDMFRYNIYDKRQKAIKITGNSLYGQTGAKTSSIYEKDVAACTTATGRKLLHYAKSVIETVYKNKICNLKDGTQVRTNAEYVYGDTDSVFFKFNLTDLSGNKIIGKEALKITIELAQEAGKLATQFLKKPHDLEYEKTFLPFILLSKKRYVGILYEFDYMIGKLKSMGLVLKRRDNANIVKDIYGAIINILMKGGNVEQAIEFVRECLDNIINGKYPIEKLIVTKSLRSHYKNPQQIAHNVLAERITERDPGNKPSSGDRIPYVFIEISNKKALQGEKIELPSYVLEQGLKINYGFYITNQIMKPLQQLFALVLEKIKAFKQKKGHTLHKWYKELEQLKEKWPNEEKYRKKVEELRCKEIKALIFDEYLNRLK